MAITIRSATLDENKRYVVSTNMTVPTSSSVTYYYILLMKGHNYSSSSYWVMDKWTKSQHDSDSHRSSGSVADNIDWDVGVYRVPYQIYGQYTLGTGSHTIPSTIQESDTALMEKYTPPTPTEYTHTIQYRYNWNDGHGYRYLDDDTWTDENPYISGRTATYETPGYKDASKVFDYWQSSSGESYAPLSKIYEDDEDTVLTAVWKDQIYHKITYTVDYEDGQGTQTFHIDEWYDEHTNITNRGVYSGVPEYPDASKIFSNWRGRQGSYSPGGTITESYPTIDLVAVWHAYTYHSITYTVDYEDGQGTQTFHIDEWYDDNAYIVNHDVYSGIPTYKDASKVFDYWSGPSLQSYKPGDHITVSYRTLTLPAIWHAFTYHSITYYDSNQPGRVQLHKDEWYDDYPTVHNRSVWSTIPTKTGSRFDYWESQSENQYHPGEHITEGVATAYLYAFWKPTYTLRLVCSTGITRFNYLDPSGGAHIVLPSSPAIHEETTSDDNYYIYGPVIEDKPLYTSEVYARYSDGRDPTVLRDSSGTWIQHNVHVESSNVTIEIYAGQNYISKFTWYATDQADAYYLGKGKPISHLTASVWNKMLVKVKELSDAVSVSYHYTEVQSGDPIAANKLTHSRSVGFNEVVYALQNLRTKIHPSIIDIPTPPIVMKNTTTILHDFYNNPDGEPSQYTSIKKCLNLLIEYYNQR